MKNHVKKPILLQLFVVFLFMNAFTTLSAMKRFARTGQAYRIIENRPNAKSSLGYFTTSPDRSCILRTRTTTPLASKAFIQKRDLSIGQIGTGLWKRFRWNLLSPEDRKTELFSALAYNIQNNNRDKSLSSIINLFKSENLLKEPEQQEISSAAIAPLDLTPLEFAIEFSNHSDTDYQKTLINSLLENGAQLHDTKELDLAYKHYNLGALQALLPYISADAIYNFYEIVKKQIDAQEKEYDNAQTLNYKRLVQKRIRKLRRIEYLLENKTSFFPYEKESELK